MKSTLRLIACLAALTAWVFPTGLHAQTTATLKTLYTFSHAGESSSDFALAQGVGDNLFGVTTFGGMNDDGTMFKLTTAGDYASLYNFDSGGNDGYEPSSALTLGSDGNFYGETDYGGENNYGTIYRITPTGGLTIIHPFDVTDGYYPGGVLALGNDGNFYGTTVGGGSGGGEFGHGTAFKITPKGGLTTLHNFTGTDGQQPGAGVILGSDGAFYGTTPYGGAGSAGTVFRVTGAGAFKSLYSFAGGAEAGQPLAGLVEVGSGLFYGATGGGANGDGTIFSITSAGKYTPVYTFAGTDGREPSALALGNDGNLYGATEFGGTSGLGTVFQLTPDGHLTTLINFNSADANGIYPSSGLLLASDGFFYGVTAGGTVGKTTIAGTAYQLDVTTAAGTVEFSASTYSVKEAAGSVTLTVRRVGGTGGSIAVNYAETNGTAVAGTDYKSTTGKLTWADADATNRTFTVPIIDRGLTGGGTKTFTAKLSPVTGGGSVGAISSASVNILDNDPALPVITSAAAATAEQGKAFSYQITAKYDPTSFNATGLPSGLSVNKTTGVISGTPASTASGVKTLNLSAANAAGTGMATLMLTITK